MHAVGFFKYTMHVIKASVEAKDMKRNDIVLIVLLLMVSAGALLGVRHLQNLTASEDGTARVFYQGELVLEIELKDGSATAHHEDVIIDMDEHIYIVPGNLGDVTIRYRDHQVEVIDETSPRNICQHQGRTNSPYKPLTCLPNDVVIRIQRATDSDGIVQ